MILLKAEDEKIGDILGSKLMSIQLEYRWTTLQFNKTQRGDRNGAFLWRSMEISAFSKIQKGANNVSSYCG